MTRPQSRSSASGSFYARSRQHEQNRDRRRRWLIAAAVSIALNEILAGFLHWPAPAPEAAGQPTSIVLERPRPTPRPTPRATPRPTPRPVVHVPPRATLAPVPQVAGARAPGLRAPRHGGAPAKVVHHFRHLDIYAQLNKSRLGRAAGVSGSGSGTGSGTGSGGGSEGAGNGLGRAGAGTGAVNADTPCGEVVFNVHGAPEYHNGAATEHVTATVAFPDGHTETDSFPYSWTYADGEHEDPWSSTNLAKPNLDIPLIFPPAGADSSTFPPLIRYILDHTRPNGNTVLEPCPNASALPTH